MKKIILVLMILNVCTSMVFAQTKNKEKLNINNLFAYQSLSKPLGYLELGATDISYNSIELLTMSINDEASTKYYSKAHAISGGIFSGLGLAYIIVGMSIGWSSTGTPLGFLVPSGDGLEVLGSSLGMAGFYTGLAFSIIGAAVLATGWKTEVATALSPVKDLSIVPYVAPDSEGKMNYGVNFAYTFLVII